MTEKRETPIDAAIRKLRLAGFTEAEIETAFERALIESAYNQKLSGNELNTIVSDLPK